MNKQPPSTSRFDALMNAARHSGNLSDPQSYDSSILEKDPTTKKKKSKSSNPNYVRTTVYLPKTLHQQLKMASIEGEQDMSEIVEQLVSEWIRSKSPS